MKIFTLIGTILLFALNTNAQNISYFSLKSSWGFEMTPFNNSSFINSNDDDGIVKHQRIDFSLGNGFKTDMSFGYLIDDIFGLELQAQYHFGKTIEFDETSVIISVSQHIHKELIGASFNLIPKFVLNYNLGNFFIRSKFGPSFSFINQKLYEKITVDEKIAEKFWKYKSDLSIGLYSDFNVGYNINEKIALVLSCSFLSLSYNPDRMTVEEYYVDGMSRINSLSVSEKEVIFVDWSYNEYNQPPQDPSEPSLKVTEVFSYSNFAINFGFEYSF